MAIVKDLIGKRFGKLLVISKNDTRGNKNQIKWNCVCDCGNTHTVTGESIRSGKSKSCGCLLKESRYVKNNNEDRERAMLLLLYSVIKKRHRKKTNNENYLDFETFKKLSLSNCYYCGIAPSNTLPDKRYENRNGEKKKIIITNYILKHNGIDRKDSSKGYETDNCVSSCRRCNVAKLDSNIDDFKNHIQRIYIHFCNS